MKTININMPASFGFLIFLAIVLCAGEPDLLDALIQFIDRL